MADPAQLRVTIETADDMAALGGRLGELLVAGDLVLLTGELGAGKTVLAQGIGAALDVRGAVTSPTFVISRVHPSLSGGPPLLHVDAYRLHGSAELDDLDLDVLVEDAVTVVEWGSGLAETLAEDRLEVAIVRRSGADPTGVDEEAREVTVTAVGDRWRGVDLAAPIGSDADGNRQ